MSHDDLQYSAVPLDLTAMDVAEKASLIAASAALDFGDRLTIASPPAWVPPDTISQLVESLTETIDTHRWGIAANAAAPETPWQVGVLNSTTNGKLDCSAATLNAGLTTAETTAYVAINDSCLWSTTGEPYDWRLDAERVTVTAMTTNPITFVAAGTAAHADNAQVTPGLPAGVQKGDLLLIFAAIRNSGTGTANVPAGYTSLRQASNIRLFGKIHTGTESAPTVTFAGGVAGATTSAQMAAFRNAQALTVESAIQLNASAQDIAYPELLFSPPRNNCLILYIGWKQDDWTSVATLAGATEIGEPATTTGDDQGLVWDYVIQTAFANIPSGSFTVTGGAAAISRGMVVALAGDVQTATLTRSVNTVAQTHAAGDEVHLFNPFRLSK